MSYVKKRYWLLADDYYYPQKGLESVCYGSDSLEDVGCLYTALSSMRSSHDSIEFEGKYWDHKDWMRIFDSVDKEYIKID